MKHARVVPTLGLFSVFGFAAVVIGCSEGAQPAAGENIRPANREFFKSKTSQNKPDGAPKGRSTKGP
jgi:hypothetical protein